MINIFNYLKANQLGVFLSVLTLFPTIRLLTIGSEHASGFLLVISLIPEILFSVIVFFGFLSIYRDSNRDIHLLDKIVLMYFVFNVLIGSCLSQDFTAIIYGFRLTYLPMIGYFICSFYWDKGVSLEKLFHGVFKVLIVVAVVGFILYFFFPEAQFYFHRLSSKGPVLMAFKGFVRMTSIFWTPVVFAMLMLSAFCYWTYRYFKTSNIYALIYMLIAVNAVFFSVSRGPMIASFIAFGLLLILGKTRREKLIALGVIFLELLIFYFFIPQFSELMEWVFISSRQTASLENANTRVSLWNEVIRSIEHHPFGLGLGKAGHAAVSLYPKNTAGISTASTDGWYFKLMIETGVQALAFYLVMSSIFFISMIRYIRRTGLDFVSVIFAIFIVTGLVNVVSNALDFYMFSYLYWFLLGLFVFKLKQKNA
jgi:O-antigen ligase